MRASRASTDLTRRVLGMLAPPNQSPWVNSSVVQRNNRGPVAAFSSSLNLVLVGAKKLQFLLLGRHFLEELEERFIYTAVAWIGRKTKHSEVWEFEHVLVNPLLQLRKFTEYNALIFIRQLRLEYLFLRSP